jgi:uncharacterized protein YaiI (UPF0178 family)
MKVLIDADACPRGVMESVRRLQIAYGYELVTISSFNHVHDGVNHITVGDGDQAADMALINRTSRGDIVVTQDWGLAALALGKGAKAIDPGGRIHTNDQMDFLLEERHLKAKFRRGGGRTKGPSARTAMDDERFEANFKKLLDGVV